MSSGWRRRQAWRHLSCGSIRRKALLNVERSHAMRGAWVKRSDGVVALMDMPPEPEVSLARESTVGPSGRERAIAISSSNLPMPMLR